jgi:hypothetical protein
MSKQTAVDFFIEELGEYFPHEIAGIHLMVEKAKEMEKQQIENAFENGMDAVNIQNLEQYYNKTFKK